MRYFSPQTTRKFPKRGQKRQESLRLYGRHTVQAALKNPDRKLKKIWITQEMKVKMENLPARIEMHIVTAQDLRNMMGDEVNHQGIVLETEPLESPFLHDVLEKGADQNRPLLILDQVTDPQNIGAILRSAAAFGALALVTQDRHSPLESSSLAKAASGAVEVIPWVRVVNLARALDEIAEAGFWRIGLQGGAFRPLESVLGTVKPALILGAEGEGLRPNTQAHCDEQACLTISNAVESLNVSNAAAIALYEARRSVALVSGK